MIAFFGETATAPSVCPGDAKVEATLLLSAHPATPRTPRTADPMDRAANILRLQVIASAIERVARLFLRQGFQHEEFRVLPRSVALPIGSKTGDSGVEIDPHGPHGLG